MPSATNTHPALVSKRGDAVLFDAYGTLFDVYSVAQLAEELFPGHGQELSVLWRDKQIEYTRLVTTCNHGAHYRPFSELTRAALNFAIIKIASYANESSTTAQFNLSYGQHVERLLDQYQHLSAFPENRAVLETLKSRGVTTGILSNGDPAMLNSAVHSAGLTGLLDHVISVDPVRKFKTHPDAYALGEEVLQRPAKTIVFVSSNSWDALGATWYGYQTLWVNRYHQPFDTLGTGPTRTGNSLHDVLDFFPEPDR